MIVSYKLLQTYFTKKLPTPDAIADALTFHAFEIEGMEAKDGDTIIDVKVLPNRAHDCLSHRGVAREVAAIMGIPLKNILESKLPKAHRGIRTITVDIKDKRVLRYMSLVIDGVAVGPSPAWLIDALNSLGQRSINNIVDATNYTMFMLGQPIHAFDLAKVSGSGIVA
jgi:phenylalanyl-tRNA synthetase beta chain